MLWIIIAVLLIIVAGIVVLIKKDDVHMWIIATPIVFVLIMVVNNSQLYGTQLCRIKNYEKSIPSDEARLVLLEKNAMEEPTTYAALVQYQIEQKEIDILRRKIAIDRSKYFEEVHHLQLRNSWTNIFVMFNGRFTEKPIEFSQNNDPYPGM